MEFYIFSLNTTYKNGWIYHSFHDRDLPEARQDVLSSLLQLFMMLCMIYISDYVAVNLVVLILPGFVQQKFLSHPKLACSMLNGDLILPFLEICFLSIQCFRVYSVWKPYDFRDLNHERNSWLLLKIWKKKHS